MMPAWILLHAGCTLYAGCTLSQDQIGFTLTMRPLRALSSTRKLSPWRWPRIGDPFRVQGDIPGRSARTAWWFGLYLAALTFVAIILPSLVS